MQYTHRNRRIWVYTDSSIGRCIGLLLALIWIAGGALAVYIPSSWMAYQDLPYLVVWAMLKVLGACTLYLGISTLRDLRDTS